MNYEVATPDSTEGYSGKYAANFPLYILTLWFQWSKLFSWTMFSASSCDLVWVVWVDICIMRHTFLVPTYFMITENKGNSIASFLHSSETCVICHNFTHTMRARRLDCGSWPHYIMETAWVDQLYNTGRIQVRKAHYTSWKFSLPSVGVSAS